MHYVVSFLGRAGGLARHLITALAEFGDDGHGFGGGVQTFDGLVNDVAFVGRHFCHFVTLQFDVVGAVFHSRGDVANINQYVGGFGGH